MKPKLYKAKRDFILDCINIEKFVNSGILVEVNRICPACGWTGAEAECVDYKHPTGARLCPNCYEVTEEIKDK